MRGQSAELDWRDGVPVARAFDDPYFSLADGLEETRHVFLAGNGLPERFRDGLHIAELGFGTGLNLLTALQAWEQAGTPGRLRFTSFEAFPISAADRARALAAFPALTDWADLLNQSLILGEPVQVGPAEVHVITGDARQTLPAWDGKADAWFLDGFAPAKNPELWEPELMQAVAEHTAPGGSFATYTAAGAVRRSLAVAGFEVTRRPGYGRKRHMTTGRMP